MIGMETKHTNTKIDFSTIDAFLFDLGGVIIDIDPQATINAFSELGLPQLQQQINHGHHEGLFKQLEKGAISRTHFIHSIKEQLDRNIEETQIVEAWNKMLVDFPDERLRILEHLKKTKPVYLLSNTNLIHHKRFAHMANGYKSIDDLFTQTFYSYQLGCSKPDAEPFEKVISATHIKPEKTLFLDDSLMNIETAQQLGFQTAWVKTGHTMQEIFTGM